MRMDHCLRRQPNKRWMTKIPSKTRRRNNARLKRKRKSETRKRRKLLEVGPNLFQR